MAIDIRNISSDKITTGRTDSKRVLRKNTSSTSEATDPADDSVELTGKAAQIQSLIQQMLAAPAVDRSRVEPVKEKIEEGRYEIDDQRVASKMIDFEVGYSRVR
jgi:negative regulator of flagellin synthesis FlgM